MRKTLMIAGILLVCCGIASGAETARKGGRKMVKLETSLGVIKVELYPEKAPVSVKNFLTYVNEGHYDGLIFHRVIRDFMLQGGGFTKDMKERGSKHPPIRNEADNGLKNDRGTLAMARTSVVDSATSQFFINTVNNDFLNHRAKTPQGYGYAVFGKVTEGMDVVDKIRAVPTGNVGMFQDVPLTPVTIIKATVAQE
jgi:cyclophilin family peptidyl-prolyl cis-trans isomerase